MLRVVLDTNIVISGSLWSGTPHLVLQFAASGRFKPLVNEIMLDELKDVLERPKFSARLTLLNKSAAQIVEEYIALADIVETEAIEPIVHADADDDQVLACALSGDSHYVVSGDPHLLELKQYKNISILTATTFLALLDTEIQSDDE